MRLTKVNGVYINTSHIVTIELPRKNVKGNFIFTVVLSNGREVESNDDYIDAHACHEARKALIEHLTRLQ